MANKRGTKPGPAQMTVTDPLPLLERATLRMQEARTAWIIVAFAAAGAIALGLFLGNARAAVVATVVGIAIVGVFRMMQVASKKPTWFATPAKVLMWGFAVLFLVFLILLITTAFMRWPLAFDEIGTSASAKVPNIVPATSIESSPTQARVGLLVGRTEIDPVFWLYNDSTVAADGASYEMRLYDLSVEDPDVKGRKLSLDVPAGMTGPILAGRPDPQSPHSLRKLARRGSAMQRGHVVFGAARVACTNCAGPRDFWLWITIGEGGWFHEMSGTERNHVDAIIEAAVAGETPFDPDRWISPAGSVPAAQHFRDRGWVWAPAMGRPDDPSAAPMRKLFGWKTWQAGAWRDYQLGDEKLEGAVMAPAMKGSGSIDPTLPVITKEANIPIVDEMHARFAEKK